MMVYTFSPVAFLFAVEAEYGCGYIPTDGVRCYTALEAVLLRWEIIRRFVCTTVVNSTKVRFLVIDFIS